MRIEKILKRKTGQIKIDMSLSVAMRDAHWSIYVCKKGKGCRKWVDIFDASDYDYRSLSMPKRRAYRRKFILKHVTMEELKSLQYTLLHELSATFEDFG